MCRLVLCVLTIAAIGSAVQKPDITILEDHGTSITIEYVLSGYEIKMTTINGIECSRILLPGHVTFLDRGLPELPTIAYNIIIPDDAIMDYHILDIEYETKKVAPIIPSKGDLLRTVDPETVPYTFDVFYQTDSWWPENTIELSEPFILRDYRGLTVRFNPFQYNPVQNELKIAKRIVVEVHACGKGGTNIVTRKRHSVTREFVGIYESFLNFSEARYDSLTERAGRMVIITDDDYVNTMQEFVAWKRQKGIDTKMVTITSIGGNTEVNIKNYIQTEYDAGDLVWVLLVGDGNEVRPATGTIGWASGEDADPVYAYTAGSDYYPDIFISRFSSLSGDSTAILKQISRSIGYEKEPQIGADWYHIGLGVASEQDGGTGIDDSTRCNWLRDSLLQYHYTEVNKSYDYWGTSAMIKGFIEDGTSVINYIGNGGIYGWGNGGGFSTTNINNLDNPWMLPFVISVACFVGNFDGPDCYCEVSVTAGEIEQPDGFLVHWGSTIHQSWVPPCIGQEGAVNRLTHDLSNTAGGIFFNGACYMLENYGLGSADMAQTWTIFGDASIQLRTDTPQEITVSHPDSIDREQLTFDVSVPGVSNALIGLYADTAFVGSGYTDTLGNATVDINDIPSGADVMHITVTAYNKIPYIDSIPILSTAVHEDGKSIILKTALTSVSPSVFHDKLIISYQVADTDRTSKISMHIYDVSGRLVKKFNNLPTQSFNQIIWNGRDQRDSVVPGGVYFVHFTAGDYTQIEKAVFLK